MKRKIYSLAVIFIMLGLLSFLFGCGKTKKPDYPFDAEKAYHQSRSGLMAGADYVIKTEPEGIVEVYSYSKPVDDDGDGMRDRGADIFYVGTSPGETKVTVTKRYPTCLPEEFSFLLCVGEDLSVKRKSYALDYCGEKPNYENAEDFYTAGTKVILYYNYHDPDREYKFLLNGEELEHEYINEQLKISFYMPEGNSVLECVSWYPSPYFR
ncbi:MAG: hypothetical protein E7479_08615 [Ruminococcaceae bacterium]|nr:hypothetical protein [Oscillospiraceae bacterium]